MPHRVARLLSAAAVVVLAPVAYGSPALAEDPQSAPEAGRAPAVLSVGDRPSSVGDRPSSVVGRPSETRPFTAPDPVRDDTVRAEQWHLKTLNVADAWAYATGEGVIVAVIDSGVDADHPDLVGQVLPGLDLVAGTGDGRKDVVGHGTTVSAIIAGRNDDDEGVVGIAPKSKILPVRVLDENNRYDDALIVAKAVRWAVDHGARVINLSLGGNGNSASLAAALDYAFAKDVVVVACTGNKSPAGPTDVWYPAREPGVLAVAGMERNGDVLWSDSITGPQTVVTAPATQIIGAGPDGYWQVQGTSFAAPMVSGVAALVRSRWPTMSAAEVISRIIKTAKDRGPVGHDNQFGYGLVDPTGALTADVPAVTVNPLDTAPPPGIARFGSAPTAGQAQSAPDKKSSPLQAGARVPGANAGWAVSPTEPEPRHSSRGWWAAAAFLLLSAGIGVYTIRRFNGLV